MCLKVPLSTTTVIKTLVKIQVLTENNSAPSDLIQTHCGLPQAFKIVGVFWTIR